MVALRGEMALAQGLKLALLSGTGQRAGQDDHNASEVAHLLFGGELRFWHARLVLVQATLAHAWRHDDAADYFTRELLALQSRERHPLTRRAIELALQGLRDLNGSSDHDRPLDKYQYMWTHEREAVTSVEQSSWKVSRLAADVVLLSNMTYRLWEQAQQLPSVTDRASEVAARAGLPKCIGDCSHRSRIASERQDVRGCDCAWGLCAYSDPPAVTTRWGRFTEGFCREQARLAKDHGPPSWARTGRVRDHADQLAEYWEREAESIAVKVREEEEQAKKLEENGATRVMSTSTASSW